MKIKNAVIMAAGRGMRMMPLTDIVPKAMIPYKGSTLIANGIDKIRKHIEHIYITVGYKGALLAQHVIEHNVTGIFNTEGKDNAWWLFNTLLKELDEPVFVLTCDNVIELNFDLLAHEYYELGEPACMVVPVTPVSGLDGDYIFGADNIINKLTRAEKSNIYCSGIQVLNPAKINRLVDRCDNFYKVWQQLITLQELYYSNTYPSEWYAVDTVEQLQRLK
ncbi:nucleotidyltransferase family protein [Niabella aurantiaca]|uniref:nucleotidyltransferase family protein n=1 Tax=Niabella aurantiaca TaxID=379900 RepID=UPI000378448B|nr:sugar phosphate nucleotidyltransferase [Niabella aurantiaca]